MGQVPTKRCASCPHHINTVRARWRLAGAAFEANTSHLQTLHPRVSANYIKIRAVLSQVIALICATSSDLWQ